mmetsp:Transcript_44559/g.107361  ORF Transcript_44559/g.107361 Transcript_44559/m.107361 type:complete len:89 (-) Transcript_44559:1040-1306(-)
MFASETMWMSPSLYGRAQTGGDGVWRKRMIAILTSSVDHSCCQVKFAEVKFHTPPNLLYSYFVCAQTRNICNLSSYPIEIQSGWLLLH